MFGNVEAFFRSFVRGTYTRKWMISADFVLSGDERVNDTFAFTVFRYEKNSFQEVLSEANQAITRDFKRVKSIPPETLAYLSSRERFHFCFMPDRGRHEKDNVKSARAVIESTITSIKAWPEYPGKADYIKMFAGLRQEANARLFPFKLLNDVTLLGALAAAIAFYITKHSNPEHIAFFLDRDNMTTAFHGLLSWAVQADFASICSENGVDHRRVTLGNAVEKEASNGQIGWFDSLVRPPDYLAGAMARWDLKANVLRSGLEKYLQIANTIVAENPHVAIAQLHFSMFGHTASNVRTFAKEGTNLQAYMPVKDQWIDYLSSQAARDWTRMRPTIKAVGLLHTPYTPVHMRLP